MKINYALVGASVSVGSIAQVIEQWLATTGIAGSNPTKGNSFYFSKNVFSLHKNNKRKKVHLGSVCPAGPARLALAVVAEKLARFSQNLHFNSCYF